jgi:hypothetical protein
LYSPTLPLKVGFFYFNELSECAHRVIEAFLQDYRNRDQDDKYAQHWLLQKQQNSEVPPPDRKQVPVTLHATHYSII